MKTLEELKQEMDTARAATRDAWDAAAKATAKATAAREDAWAAVCAADDTRAAVCAAETAYNKKLGKLTGEDT